MYGNFRLRLLRLSRAIWFLPALFTVLAILGLVTSAIIDSYLPMTIDVPFDLTIVDRILEILASSMLAVAIFSLTTMVTAIQTATQSASPRIRSLLIEDRSAQTAISIFLGTFLFGLLGVIGLSTGLYGPPGRFLLFVLTLFTIAAVVVALIRWIQRLSRLGGVTETIDRAETATRRAFEMLAGAPHFHGCCRAEAPDGFDAISAARIGYVQHLDASRLGDLSEENGIDIHIVARPGKYVDRTRPLAFVSADASQEARDGIRRAFVVGGERTFESDPSFGLIVLSEIASRALSPAVNDPGTAIDVIGTQTRVLDEWGAKTETTETEVRYPRLSVAAIDPQVLFIDAFAAIARDGATMIEVQLRLQKSLATLAATHSNLFDRPARYLSNEALERARTAMTYAGDKHILASVAATVGSQAVADPMATGCE